MPLGYDSGYTIAAARRNSRRKSIRFSPKLTKTLTEARLLMVAGKSQHQHRYTGKKESANERLICATFTRSTASNTENSVKDPKANAFTVCVWGHKQIRRSQRLEQQA